MSNPTVLSNGAKVSPTVSPRELLRAVVSGQMTEEEYEKLLQGHYAARSIESPCPVDRAEFLAHAKESPLAAACNPPGQAASGFELELVQLWQGGAAGQWQGRTGPGLLHGHDHRQQGQEVNS